MNDLYRKFESNQKGSVMLSYKGEVSFDLVKSMLDNVEARLEKIEKNLKTKKKVFNVLVECFQNLSHHIETSDPVFDDVDEGKMAFMIVSHDDDSYYVTTGNFILNSAIPKLKAWLNEINSRDEKSLRALYKEVLNNETFSEKGGGGLGFIDITRKAGTKMEYAFHKMEKSYSVFEFKIRIPKEK